MTQVMENTTVTVVEDNFQVVQPERKSQAAWRKFGTIGFESYVAFLRYGKPVVVELEAVVCPTHNFDEFSPEDRKAIDSRLRGTYP